MELLFILGIVVLLFGPIIVVVLVVRYLMRRSEQNRGPLAPAAWAADPTGRHELRYWDGAAWSPSVSDGGAQSEDPM